MNRRYLSIARAIAVGLCVVAIPSATLAQVDEGTGERDNFVLAPDGTMLVVTSPTDNNAGLVRRSAGGFDSTIVAPNANLSLGTIEGIGSNPHMNAGGVAAFQIQFDSAPTNTAIYTGVPGDIDLIADTGDTLGSDTVCSIEPFPLINSNNQVFFGTSLVVGTCAASEDEGRKGIYRFTPPSTIDLMLLAAVDGSGAQILISDTDFVPAPTNFDVVDAHMISFGGDVASSAGGIMITATIRPAVSTSTCDNADVDPCQRVLLYLGPTPGTVQLIAAEGTSSIFDGKKLKGVANNNAKALFKAQLDDIEGLAGEASLQTWTSGGGLQPLVEAGDAIPGATTGTFGGFTPHADLNDQGNAAFTAGLNIGETCDGTDLITGFGGTGLHQNRCRGVYFATSAGVLTEIARTTTATVAEAGAPSILDGFAFEEIGSVAVIDQCNTVYFVANNNDAHGVCGVPPTGTNTPAFGGGGRGSLGGDVTGVFAWNNVTGLTTVIREGDLVTDGRVMRLFTAMPELRQNAENQKFAIRAWIDTDADCDADIEETLVATVGVGCGVAPSPTPTNTLVPGQPTSTPTRTPIPNITPGVTPHGIGGSVAPGIPALGPSGVWFLVGLLALAGALLLWRRGN